MGEVYRARDTRLAARRHQGPADRRTAAAWRASSARRKAIAALNHPSICSIYDVGTSPVPFLVMELLEGETLHQRLARGPSTCRRSSNRARAGRRARRGARQGIVHRDLKPANIFLTRTRAEDPRLRPGAHQRNGAPPDVDATAYPTLRAQSLTDAGVAVGTVAYMSPEQLRGEALDARPTSSLSAGALRDGHRPARVLGTTSAVTSAAILHEQPAAPRATATDLPPRFEQAILTLLEKDREVRTQTALELRAELTR